MKYAVKLYETRTFIFLPQIKTHHFSVYYTSHTLIVASSRSRPNSLFKIQYLLQNLMNFNDMTIQD